MAEICKQIVAMGHELVIVHGAGSFGHIRAKEYRLAEGDIQDLDQSNAINLVRSDMDMLHTHVIEALTPLVVHSHAPRDYVTNTGANFQGDLDRFLQPGVHVTFGDVVDCEPPELFGILSGDDLMLRLSNELPDVEYTIFAMGGTPGVMTDFGNDAKIIPKLTADTGFTGIHESDIDVTGGIFLKVERAFEISRKVDHVWFIDGHHPERVLEILHNGETIGTRICDV